MAKLRVGLLLGGRSVEHEVSLASATSVMQALDPARYDVRLIGVDRDGRWHLAPPDTLPAAVFEAPVAALPAAAERGAVVVSEGGASARLDVVLPVIHGSGGEDGSLQGLLELAGLPYAGAGVLGSAIGMDKEVSKRLLNAANLPVVPWVSLRARELEPAPHGPASDSRRDAPSSGREPHGAAEEPRKVGREPRDAALAARLADRVAGLGLPLFVKPASLGSSVGISKVDRLEDLLPALREAARYDDKLLIEKAVDAREIEVGVIGNDHPEASVPGEIQPRRSFYDYEAKYVDDATELRVPAVLDKDTAAEARRLALAAYGTLEASGFARVDFLLDRRTGDLFISEINTVPGFTEASMFPRLWEASGLSYPALLDRLIELALERHARRSALETTYHRG